MDSTNVTPLKGDKEVKMSDIKIRPEMTITTVIAIAAFVFTLFVSGAGWLWAASQWKASFDILQRDFNTYIAQHADVHKDASSQRTGEISRLNTQIETLNLQNLPYRVGSLEAQYANTTKNMDDIKTQMNALSADQRLMSQKIEQSDLKLDRVLSILNNGIPLPSTPRNQ